MKIVESKNTAVYKKLLRILGDYCSRVPATGVDQMFNQAVENGRNIMPKDKRALAILDQVLCPCNVPSSVQHLLNMRFSDVVIGLRPLTKAGNRHEVAFWNRGDHLSDKVKDLIAWDGKGGAGHWSNYEGDSATLIDYEQKSEICKSC